MSIHGVHVVAQQSDNQPVSDLELERIFVSLESNMAIRSIDIAGALDEGTISFLLGVECPNGLDSESLITGIVDDALGSALSGDGSQFKHAAPVLTPSFC